MSRMIMQYAENGTYTISLDPSIFTQSPTGDIIINIDSYPTIEEPTMFSENLFLNDIIAKRIRIPQIDLSERISTYIYVRVGQPIFSGICIAHPRMIRNFTESDLGAAINHSTNWINKLQREYGNSYWTEQLSEYGSRHDFGDHKLFIDERFIVSSGDITRLQEAVRPPVGTGLSPARVAMAFQAALEGHVPQGSLMRNAILENFIREVRPGG